MRPLVPFSAITLVTATFISLLFTVGLVGPVGLNLKAALAAPAPSQLSVTPDLLQGLPPEPDPGNFLTGPSSGDPLDIVLGYLHANARQLRLTNDDLADFVIKDRYVSSHNNVTHIYLRQRYQGIEVFNGDIAAHIAGDGSIITLHNDFVYDLKNVINTSTPALSPLEAANRGIAELGLVATEPLQPLRNLGGADQQVILSSGGLVYDEIPVKLMYQPTSTGAVQLVWEVSLHLRATPNWWNIRVDAVTGRILSQNDWIVNETYNVFPAPFESPDAGAQSSVNNPFSAGGVASPQGWHDTNGTAGPEFTITRGNNVHAYADQDNNNQPDAIAGSQPDGGPTLTFNPSLNLALEPQTYLTASVVNLFYWNNIVHDVFYQYGFNEAAGNFQQNNLGRGGQGNDQVLAEAQDGVNVGARNNANFATPPDGSSGRMQMYLWNYIAPQRDSDLDNGVIIHEYGHGISTRLTGGPSNSSCLFNNEQMGEGWSDWFALALTAKASDTATTSRAMGTYLLGQPTSGAGIRPARYNTDFGVNNYTYNNIKTLAVPHGVGFVWASMLWDMYWLMVDKYGFNPNLYQAWNTGGNNLALQLVVDGLALQKCSPGFVDGRNAILQADQTLTGGQNQCLIWQAFARRGLGYSADQGSSNSNTDGTQAFDLPPLCQFGQIQPANLSVCVGANAVYTLTLGSVYTSSVTLAGSGQPAGSTLTFNPAGPLAPPFPKTSQLTVGNTAGATPGNYTLVVTATSSGVPHTFNAGLTVFDGAPTASNLQSPANNATNVSLSPTFTWNDVGSTVVASYTLEIATNNLFSSLVYSTTIATRTHVLPVVLLPQTTYYWRVRPQNSCGSATSTIYNFTTRPYGSVLLVDDDDNGPNVLNTYTQTLTALGRTYDVWNTQNSDNEPSAALLNGYNTLIWFTGADYGGTTGPSGASETNLSNWLDSSGKCLMVSGQDYLYARARNGVFTPFMSNYLGLAQVQHDLGQTTVTGAGTVFGGLGPYSLAYPFSYVNYSDAISSTASAAIAFNGDRGPAAVYKQTAAYRTTFLAYPFETLPDNTARQGVMTAFLNWCDNSTPLRPRISLSGPGGTEALSVSQSPNQQATQTLTLSNTGSASLTWSITEDDVTSANLSPGSVPVTNPAVARRRNVPAASDPSITPQLLTGVVTDGSFEQGIPNPAWDEFSTNFGTPLCDVSCAEGPAPRSGDFYAWFGGIDIPETGILTQTVTIQASPAATLTFYLLVGICDSPADFLDVYMDNNLIYTTGDCTPGYDYVQQSVNISPYADGASHTLVFYSETYADNGSFSNFFMDDVDITVQEACDTLTNIPWITAVSPSGGTLGMSQKANVEVTFNSTGLSGGLYEATLCLANNDPLRPLVKVPLTLNITSPIYLPIIAKK